MLQLSELALRRRGFLVDMVRRYFSMPAETQRLIFGDNFQSVIDKFAVLAAAYDYAVAARRDMKNPKMLAAPVSPVALLPVGDEDAWLQDVAPSIEYVLETRFVLMSLDVDALDPMDAVDVLKELQWADFWYEWYARQLDS